MKERLFGKEKVREFESEKVIKNHEEKSSVFRCEKKFQRLSPLLRATEIYVYVIGMSFRLRVS